MEPVPRMTRNLLCFDADKLPPSKRHRMVFARPVRFRASERLLLLLLLAESLELSLSREQQLHLLGGLDIF